MQGPSMMHNLQKQSPSAASAYQAWPDTCACEGARTVLLLCNYCFRSAAQPDQPGKLGLLRPFQGCRAFKFDGLVMVAGRA